MEPFFFQNDTRILCVPSPGPLRTCEGVRMHLKRALWVLLTPPTLGVDVVLGLAGSDDVTQ